MERRNFVKLPLTGAIIGTTPVVSIYVIKIFGIALWICIAFNVSCKSREKSNITTPNIPASGAMSAASEENTSHESNSPLHLQQIRDLIQTRKVNKWRDAGLEWVKYAEKHPNAALEMLCELNNTPFASFVLKENNAIFRNIILENSNEMIVWALETSFTSDTYGLLQNKIFLTIYQANPKSALETLNRENGFRNQGAADVLVQISLSKIAESNLQESWQIAHNRLTGTQLTRALRSIIVSASENNPSDAFAMSQKLESRDAIEIYPMLFNHWFKNDPAAAIKTLSSQPTSVAISVFKDGAIFEQLSFDHSELLIETLQLLPFQESTKDSYFLASKMLARKNPELLPSLLASIAPSPTKQSIIVESFTALTQQHPDLALKLVNSLQKNEKIAALHGTVRVLTPYDFGRAISLANVQDEATAGNLLREIASVTSVTNPLKATELLGNQNFTSNFDDDFRSQFVDHTARNYAAKDLLKWTQ